VQGPTPEQTAKEIRFAMEESKAAGEPRRGGGQWALHSYEQLSSIVSGVSRPHVSCWSSPAGQQMLSTRSILRASPLQPTFQTGHVYQINQSLVRICIATRKLAMQARACPAHTGLPTRQVGSCSETHGLSRSPPSMAAGRAALATGGAHRWAARRPRTQTCTSCRTGGPRGRTGSSRSCSFSNPLAPSASRARTS
jgi:hypothetical protein